MPARCQFEVLRLALAWCRQRDVLRIAGAAQRCLQFVSTTPREDFSAPWEVKYAIAHLRLWHLRMTIPIARVADAVSLPQLESAKGGEALAEFLQCILVGPPTVNKNPTCSDDAGLLASLLTPRWVTPRFSALRIVVLAGDGLHERQVLDQCILPSLLTEAPVLQRLFWKSPIGVQGAEALLCKLDALGGHSTLEEFPFGPLDISDSHVLGLLRNLPALKTLSLSCVSPGSKWAWPSVKDAPNCGASVVRFESCRAVRLASGGRGALGVTLGRLVARLPACRQVLLTGMLPADIVAFTANTNVGKLETVEFFDPAISFSSATDVAWSRAWSRSLQHVLHVRLRRFLAPHPHSATPPNAA